LKGGVFNSCYKKLVGVSFTNKGVGRGAFMSRLPLSYNGLIGTTEKL